MIDIPPTPEVSELHALVIDCEFLVYDVVNLSLREMGLTDVRHAANAYYAFSLCATTQFDIIFIAFNMNSDKDGFHILEELKLNGHVTESTTVIFLSADTDTSLVHSVVELQPTDFWVKPLRKETVIRRLKTVLSVRKKLHKLHYCIAKKDYSTAIYYAERQLVDQSIEQYHPYIHREICRCLVALKEYKDCYNYYHKLLKQYNYGWVHVGLLQMALKLEKQDEVDNMINRLLNRRDTKFATYDALAQHYIEHEQYELAYTEIKEATALAPRNISRNKKSLDLARLNHDRMGQYQASVNIAKYARHSIHDSPQLQFNVIRAAIDLGCSGNNAEIRKIVNQAEADLAKLHQSYSHYKDLHEQLHIMQARLFSLRESKDKAEKLIKDHINKEMKHEVEDNLDKVKVFHEMGYREESMKILEGLKTQVAGDSFTSKVVTEYLSQEAKERGKVHFTPKQLSKMASTYYKQKRMSSAFNALSQAILVAPDNVSMAMSLLKVLVSIREEGNMSSDQMVIGQLCKKILSNVQLTEKLKTKFREYELKLPELNETYEIKKDIDDVLSNLKEVG